MSWEQRVEVKKEAMKRMKTLSFGDAVTNVCAEERNLQRLGYFVEHKRNSSNVKCTDKKGKFWEGVIQVTFKGHLGREECESLFKPIWEANFR